VYNGVFKNPRYVIECDRSVLRGRGRGDLLNPSTKLLRGTYLVK
jgi:hypothetical protein